MFCIFNPSIHLFSLASHTWRGIMLVIKKTFEFESIHSICSVQSVKKEYLWRHCVQVDITIVFEMSDLLRCSLLSNASSRSIMTNADVFIHIKVVCWQIRTFQTIYVLVLLYLCHRSIHIDLDSLISLRLSISQMHTKYIFYAEALI